MTSTDSPTASQPMNAPESSTTSKRSAKTGSRGTRENKRDKALRLLAEGRLRVLRVHGNEIVAECRGDSGSVYALGHRHWRWACNCPARTDCSHLIALQHVTAVDRD